VLADHSGADFGRHCRGRFSLKPVPFDYERPATVADALALTRRDDLVTKFIAGGQSLGPMLNLRLAQPDFVVDISGLDELKHVEITADALSIGACITHADIEDGRIPDVTHGALRSIARSIAYRAVRNRGTIGGSLAHADPAADWICGLAALGARLVIRNERGRRHATVEDFIIGPFENALEPGEIVEAVRVPSLSKDARFGFYKLCRKAGEFAHAIGAVLDDAGRGIVLAAIGAIGSKPVVWPDASVLLGRGSPRDAALDEDLVRTALAQRGLRDPISQRLHIAALRRAFAQAYAS
jgi:aerobic carbon-monoxide dehydrogenase medium subunit